MKKMLECRVDVVVRVEIACARRRFPLSCVVGGTSASLNDLVAVSSAK